jgi:ribosomal protein L22
MISADTAIYSHQVRYAVQSIPAEKSARSRGSYLRVSFKNTRETAQAINGFKLQRALAYLENVINHKEAVPMRRYAGSTGRTAQGECPVFVMRQESGGRVVSFANRNLV